MSNQNREKSFMCRNCGFEVSLDAPGTKNRNHCPVCLYSRHVDVKRGDRKSKCGGMMKPIGVTRRDDGEAVIVHQCQSCGFISKNRVAGDDNDDLIEKLEKTGVGDRLV